MKIRESLDGMEASQARGRAHRPRSNIEVWMDALEKAGELTFAELARMSRSDMVTVRSMIYKGRVAGRIQWMRNGDSSVAPDAIYRLGREPKLVVRPRVEHRAVGPVQVEDGEPQRRPRSKSGSGKIAARITIPQYRWGSGRLW